MSDHPSAGPSSCVPDPDDAECAELTDPARLSALAESGLGSRADPVMEWFAGRVRERVGVPVALVSLVRPDEQVFPGAVGLPHPWALERRTPLSHSFCRHVIRTASPLVVADAREDPLVRDNPAIPDLGVIGYAGMPLTDGGGKVLGSLCAIDDRPHAWTDVQLETLADLATACSTELRLRLAQVDADRERTRRDELERSLRSSALHSQTLLGVSRSMSESVSVDDVRDGLGELSHGGIEPDHVALLILDQDGRTLRLLPQVTGSGRDVDLTGRTVPVDGTSPGSVAVRDGRTVYYRSRGEVDAQFPVHVGERMRVFGLHSLIATPLMSVDGPVGALVLGWRAPRDFTLGERQLIRTVATYTAQALDHASWVQRRVTVAREMQQAMLSTVPDVPGLDIAVRYRPADANEYVGGDWYDVVPLVDDYGGPDVRAALFVGDIIGHQLDAAIGMGQFRSMLRQAAWDHRAGLPSTIMQAVEAANRGLGLHAAGTGVLACVRRDEHDRWTMTWTNAGHPPPILICPGGRADLLDEHSRLFGLPRGQVDMRPDMDIDLPAGSMLVLYTDGLVERSGSDTDERIDALRETVTTHRDDTPEDLVDRVMWNLGRATTDDVVVMAVRFG